MPRFTTGAINLYSSIYVKVIQTNYDTELIITVLYYAIVRARAEGSLPSAAVSGLCVYRL